MTTKKAKQPRTPTRGQSYVGKGGVVFHWSPTLRRYVTIPDDAPAPTVPQIVGSEAVYLGDEVRLGGHGARVKITGVFKRGVDPATVPDMDAEDGVVFITDNDMLAKLGGVRPGDGAEVHVWLPTLGRWSFVGEEVTDVGQLRIANAVEICPPETKTHEED
ncbi:MAG: hypothetical protein C4523_14300 [Myxococcales bacterium]|nr:MAG: hypothetical protein C4523_14300 [Myxococcales bacterium]